MGKGSVMVRVETDASEEALQWLEFVREQPEEEDNCGAALELVAATFALCGDWITPLAVSFLIESSNPTIFYTVDHDHPPSTPAWLLRCTKVDDGLSPVVADRKSPREKHVSEINELELCAFAKEALGQPPPGEHLELMLSTVTLRAFAVTLPGGIELAPRYGRDILNPLVVHEGDRARVLAPNHGPAWMPMRVHASRENTLTHLTLELCWDFWLKNPAGLAQVREAVARVLARGRGWQLSEGEPSPLGSR